MTDKKENRRKLLKTIAAGSGAIVAGKSLPESWSKPVVDSVLLPVHAATSPTTPPGIDSDCPSASSCASEGCYGFAGSNPIIPNSGSVRADVSPSGSVTVNIEAETLGDFIDVEIGALTGRTECPGGGGNFTARGTGTAKPLLGSGTVNFAVTATGTVGCNHETINLTVVAAGKNLGTLRLRYNGSACLS